MASGLSEKQRHAPGNQDFWQELALRLLHPTQLLIIEAIWRVEEPLSATLLQAVCENQISLSLFSSKLGVKLLIPLPMPVIGSTIEAAERSALVSMVPPAQ